VGEARRAAIALAHALGFDEVAAAQAGIVATELANNIVRHAKSGEIVLRSFDHSIESGTSGLEILAIDRGPGIANVSAAFTDGFSTAGTPGNGLGAVKRLSTVAEVYTEPSHGTVVLARLQPRPAGKSNSTLEFGAVCLPKSGEEICGDAWAAEPDSSGRTAIVVADGLGHGPLAAAASGLAIRIFRDNMHLSSARIIEAIHSALRSTRGAAVAVAEVFRNRREISFTGIGNISALIVSATSLRSMVSLNGTAGAEARRIQTFTYPWPADSLLVMHSDGLASQWSLTRHPGLRFKHPSLVAATLYRDFCRQRDDVTVLVARDATA